MHAHSVIAILTEAITYVSCYLTTILCNSCQTKKGTVHKSD